MTDTCFVPDFSKYFDRLDEMLHTIEGLLILLLIVVLVAGALWIVGNILGRRRRG